MLHAIVSYRGRGNKYITEPRDVSRDPSNISLSLKNRATHHHMVIQTSLTVKKNNSEEILHYKCKQIEKAEVVQYILIILDYSSAFRVIRFQLLGRE